MTGMATIFDEKESEERETEFFIHSGGRVLQALALNKSISTPRPAGPQRIPTQNMFVLIAEDSIPILKMTERDLTLNGHRVVAAENGEVALNMMKASAYDIVLMDLQMPTMDGFEATRRIRGYEQTLRWGEERHQVIAGLSASTDDKTKEAALLSGMDFFIGKPFTILKFHHMVEAFNSSL